MLTLHALVLHQVICCQNPKPEYWTAVFSSCPLHRPTVSDMIAGPLQMS